MLNLARVFHMRTAAEVNKVALFVKADRFAFRDGVQQFQFIGNLPDLFDNLARLVAGGLDTHDVQPARGDFAHLLLDTG
ncbi:hypothetical protein HRbin14_02110 [bacterium HR14]|nr:hypothetical protein HRbin14_02110 [bacterium HR14]